MLLKKWDSLPETMRTEAVKPYYAVLEKKRFRLALKRLFDAVFSLLLLLVLSPLLIVLAVCVRLSSPGPVMFRQVRVTQYGKPFRIYKFRTMVANAEQLGSQVTTNRDSRVTGIGRFLRKYRLDELPQLLNILLGDMSFVGTRPEVPKYVERYTDEMYATLLLPAGVTSRASIEYKDEERLLEASDSPDEVYVATVLPEKMKYNLESIRRFSLANDLGTILQTVIAVFR
ncbi:MAG TPA: sugar transferase [Firmicutes bacterium]|nr:sugar transferase [Bacillota bacterium]